MFISKLIEQEKQDLDGDGLLEEIAILQGYSFFLLFTVKVKVVMHTHMCSRM